MVKRVLFFVNSLSGGGAERVCLNLSEELHSMGYECDYIILYNQDNDYQIPDYINVFSVGIPRKGNTVQKIAALIKSVGLVNGYLKAKSYDLITAHLPMSHVFASMTKLRKKTLYVMHNAQWPLNPRNSLWYNSRINLFYRRKKVVAVSEGVRQELMNDYGLKNVKTIFNPILADSFRAIYPVKRERPYFISVGRLAFPKKPDLVLDLYYKGKFFSEFDLVFLGQGEKLNDLQKKVKQLDLTECVYFEGFKKNPYEWIAGADMMLSISDSEALPMNIVESLCCKTKVVAANCKYGPNEILTGKFSEFLIDPEKDIEASVHTIEKALKEYPPITDEIVKPFNSRKIAKSYLLEWKKEFSK